MPVVIYSTQDPAGVNIAENLREMGQEVLRTEQPLLYSERFLKDIDTDFIVFASKHKSEKGVPAFTVHVPGNWNAADMGGQPGQVAFSGPIRMKGIAVQMEKERQMNASSMPEFLFSLEVDHHGPMSETPCAFVELGSTEREWSDRKLGAAVARAIANGLKERITVKEVVFGVGGGHYCPAFTRMELGTDIAVSHVLPGHHIDGIGYETFLQGIERGERKTDTVALDWKGLKGSQREKILSFVEKAGVKWRKV